MKKIYWLLFLAFVLGFALGDVQPVFAQEEDFTLEEITVTAQKREENQQKVGIPMEVISGDLLKELGRNDVDSILSELSNVVIQRTAEGLRVGMRGVSIATPAGYGEGAVNVPATVGVNLDGVYTGKRPTGTGLYDIDRVEVLFGPQSTMYAQNSPGGVINIEFNRPKLDSYELSGTMEYGNYDLFHGEGVVNAPVTETVALRGAFSFQVHDGYIDNGGDDEDSKSGRIRALWQPNEKFSFLLTGEYQTSTGRGMTSVNPFKNQSDVDDPWHSDAVLTGTPKQEAQKKFWAFVEYDFGFAQLSLIPTTSDDTYYRTTTSRQPNGSFTDDVADGWGYEDGVEVRMVSSGDSKIVWVASFNWYDAENYRKVESYYENGAYTRSDFRQKIEQQAILGQVNYPVTDRFRVIGGLRYSDDRAISSRTPIVGGGLSTLSDMQRKKPSYKAGIEYDLNDSSMLYANYTTGYRVNAESMDKNGNPFPPEKITSYTIGAKNRFFANRLQLNASAFYYDYLNANHSNRNVAYVTCDTRESIPDWSTPGGCFTTDQGGRTPGDYRIYGADIQTNWLITSQDRLNVSLSYLDAWIYNMKCDYEFTDQPYSDNWDFSGREPIQSPKLTVSLDYSHNFLLANGATITAKIDTRYQSKYLTDWLEQRGTLDQSGGWIVQEAHHIDNAALFYTHPDGKWSFTGYMKNIMNYAVKRWGDRRELTINEPRTYGVVLSVKY